MYLNAGMCVRRCIKSWYVQIIVENEASAAAVSVLFDFLAGSSGVFEHDVLHVDDDAVYSFALCNQI